jgi:hypothetical protein
VAAVSPDPGEDLHAEVVCDPGEWTLNGMDLTRCELGCQGGVAEAPDADGDGNVDDCTLNATVSNPCPNSLYAEHDGVGGCCVADTSSGEMIEDFILRFSACGDGG